MRPDVIDAMHRKMGGMLEDAKLSPEEGVSCASQLLANIIMSVMVEHGERLAHELLNRCTEASHEYINENWRSVMEAQRLQQAKAR